VDVLAKFERQLQIWQSWGLAKALPNLRNSRGRKFGPLGGPCAAKSSSSAVRNVETLCRLTCPNCAIRYRGDRRANLGWNPQAHGDYAGVDAQFLKMSYSPMANGRLLRARKRSGDLKVIAYVAAFFDADQTIDLIKRVSIPEDRVCSRQ
jgi:hypothetical protein